MCVTLCITLGAGTWQGASIYILCHDEQSTIQYHRPTKVGCHRSMAHISKSECLDDRHLAKSERVAVKALCGYCHRTVVACFLLLLVVKLSAKQNYFCWLCKWSTRVVIVRLDSWKPEFHIQRWQLATFCGETLVSSGCGNQKAGRPCFQMESIIIIIDLEPAR